jgi:hypothetical protein
MKAYTRRFLKFFLFLLVIFFIMLFLLPWISKGISFEQTFNILTGNEKMRIILIAVIAYSFVYPIINYGKKTRHLNGSFSDNSEKIEKAMAELNYVKQSENESSLVFRKSSTFARLIIWGEDKVEIDIASKPIVLSGPKRELRRIDLALDAKLLEK